jgi:hypothetical protein
MRMIYDNWWHVVLIAHIAYIDMAMSTVHYKGLAYGNSVLSGQETMLQSISL